MFKISKSLSQEPIEAQKPDKSISQKFENFRIYFFL